VRARTLHRQLKQGIPLSQALPATSVHLQPARVYPILHSRIFAPQLIDKEILDDFQVRCFKVEMDGNADRVQSQRPTEPVLKRRQATIDRVRQLIRDYITSTGFEVVLFGSARYGVDTSNSDLDLVVLVCANSQAPSWC
jgi:hypothetical protein